MLEKQTQSYVCFSNIAVNVCSDICGHVSIRIVVCKFQSKNRNRFTNVDNVFNAYKPSLAELLINMTVHVEMISIVCFHSINSS